MRTTGGKAYNSVYFVCRRDGKEGFCIAYLFFCQKILLKSNRFATEPIIGLASRVGWGVGGGGGQDFPLG
jgi:hypothetical protein